MIRRSSFSKTENLARQYYLRGSPRRCDRTPAQGDPLPRPACRVIWPYDIGDVVSGFLDCVATRARMYPVTVDSWSNQATPTGAGRTRLACQRNASGSGRNTVTTLGTSCWLSQIGLAINIH